MLAVLKKSTTLEEIYVDNAGFKGFDASTPRPIVGVLN